jgi:hypothetical protein
MSEDYPIEEPETPKVGEPEIHYDTSGANTAELAYPSFLPRTISEEEIAHSYTLEEFKQHMDDLVESTHNHATGCVEHTPVVPRVCSIKEVQRRSMTLDQFTGKLHAMVDAFYKAKACF